MKDEIQKRFEEIDQYDTMMSKIFPGYEQFPLVLLSHLRTMVGSKASVLDVGCGSGTNLLTFAANQPEWFLTGVDPAEPMLKYTLNKFKAINAEKRVKLINGTVNSLPNDSKFDLATCILVEHLLPDDGRKLELLKGIYHRIVPGGWLIIAGLNGDLKTDSARKKLNAWMEFLALQGLPKETQNNVLHRATVEDSLVSEERIRELLSEAGYINIERIYQLQLLGAWCAQKRLIIN